MRQQQPNTKALIGWHQRFIRLAYLAAVVTPGLLWAGPNSTMATASAQAAIAKAPDEGAALQNPYLPRIPAPDLTGGQWVNVAKPIALADLRGRFVLLDFWTYCCINCMHVLPELKKLEQAYPNELVVVGIHSAKFEGEHVTDNIREAALRYEIEHPVVNDSQMAIWDRYGARSWPTLVLIDPEGDVVWAASGERTAEDIKAVIDRGLPYYRAHGFLKPAPRPTLIGQGQENATPLRFPGKVLADERGKRLFIADSNHNRIVVTTLDGKLLHIVGSGATGRADGTFDACTFNHPQGMAVAGDTLYVADTENHLLRKIDFNTKKVATVAGTGKKGTAWSSVFGEDGKSFAIGDKPANESPLKTSLSSPWALWIHDQNLFIAMAGTHQIWKMPLDEKRIGPYAGNGRENIVDGPLLPRVPYDEGFASFAQPSGLTSDGKQLFVADSEGSTVRSVPFDPAGSAETLVGLTGTLFDFGDIDGRGENVRLQHPLDVAWAEGKLYVADTYNNKIKEIDVVSRTCRSIAGPGKSGLSDAEKGTDAVFNEPTGISAASGKLYVADTNNHVIRIVEIAAPNRVTTLKIEGLTAPK